MSWLKYLCGVACVASVFWLAVIAMTRPEEPREGSIAVLLLTTLTLIAAIGFRLLVECADDEL